MTIDLSDLGELSNPNTATTGDGAMQIDISLIDEDPNQPRTYFDEETLKELAETIKDRGVKSPISVRKGANGRYTVNHGARRLRASVLAGKTTIPAFIDMDYSRVDQIIENIQRDELKPMDIARFIQSELDSGKKQKDVATELGKSKVWVSELYSLLKLEEPVKELFEQNRLPNYTVAIALNNLLKKEKKNKTTLISDYLANLPEDVEITREKVRELTTMMDNDTDYFKSDSDSMLLPPTPQHEETAPFDSPQNDTVEETATGNGNDFDGDDSESGNDESFTEPEQAQASESKHRREPEKEQTTADFDNIKSVEELESEPDEAAHAAMAEFKTVKGIIGVMGTEVVTVVFRPAEKQDCIVVLTNDGVKEIPTSDFTLTAIEF